MRLLRTVHFPANYESRAVSAPLAIDLSMMARGRLPDLLKETYVQVILFLNRVYFRLPTTTTAYSQGRAYVIFRRSLQSDRQPRLGHSDHATEAVVRKEWLDKPR